MGADGSVTHWIQLLRDGDRDAAQALWERYFAQLESLAQRKLGRQVPAAADAEDVALSAMDSLFRGLGRGRFPRLQDRDNLWRLLVVITVRKAAHLVRDEHRQKRGGGPSGPARGSAEAMQELEQVIGVEPSPEFALHLAEELERLLGLLPRDDLQQVARRKLEGQTNREIARDLRCAARTVDRKLAVIRRLWERETEP